MSNTLNDKPILALLRQILGKKRYAWVVAAFLIIVILTNRGSEFGFDFPGSNVPDTVTSEQQSGEFKVMHVVDGDTFEIEGGERVRLIGIDTPETVKPNSPVECYGKESSDHLKQLLEGKSVRLEEDKTDRDRYARLLRYVYLGDQFVNELLVREGYAKSKAYKPDTMKQSVLDQAEELARSEKVGRWNPVNCPQP